MEERRVKICLLGDPEVGKTSLIRKFVLDRFDDRYIATVGTKVTKKKIEVENEEKQRIRSTLLIWDILGQKRFRKLHTSFYKGATGVIIVGDLTRKATFESLSTWLEAITDCVGSVPVVFVGNKLDLVDPDKVDTEPLDGLAEEHKSTTFLTSAKTGQNVEDVFHALAQQLADRI